MKYMRFTQSEKMEIIRIVTASEFGVNRTLRELGIHKSTFYNWYGRYEQQGYDGLAPKPHAKNTQWNRIPDTHRQKVVELALEIPELSPRELACRITDQGSFFISESSVYRILKSRGLITSPAHILMRASSEFNHKTTRPNQLWQTDFTYFKVIGWGWYYLLSILDDYSRFIVHWELCSTMKAADVKRGIDQAIQKTGVDRSSRPRLLSDNGSCYVSGTLGEYLKQVGIEHVRGAPHHPQTQGKIERWHRSMKNVVKLEHYYSPEQLTYRLAEFVDYYNHHRYHESLNNVTPADVYVGRDQKILQKRKTLKQRTLNQRRKNHRCKT